MMLPVMEEVKEEARTWNKRPTSVTSCFSSCTVVCTLSAAPIQGVDAVDVLTFNLSIISVSASQSLLYDCRRDGIKKVRQSDRDGFTMNDIFFPP